ncbi:MAG: hypothetical protein ACKVOP_04240 [Sphingomonadaceae bacterium]
MHAEHALTGGTKDGSAGDLRPADDEKPIEIGGSENFDCSWRVDIPDFDKREIVRGTEAIQIDSAGFRPSHVVLKRHCEIKSTADAVNRLHARKPELNAGDKTKTHID